MYISHINFLSVNKLGFRIAKLTDYALLVFTEHVFCNLNTNNKTTSLFINFKKAVDFVNNKYLLMKIEADDVRGVTLKWFASFLYG